MEDKVDNISISLSNKDPKESLKEVEGTIDYYLKDLFEKYSPEAILTYFIKYCEDKNK